MKCKKITALVVLVAICINMITPLASAENNQTQGMVFSGNIVEKRVDQSKITAKANNNHDGNPASNVLDGDIKTNWDAAWQDGDPGLGVTPNILTFNLDQVHAVSRFTWLPRQDNNANGYIKAYKLTGIKADDTEVDIVKNGTCNPTATLKTVTFAAVEVKALRFTVVDAVQNPTQTTIAEVNVYEQRRIAKLNKEAITLKEKETSTLVMEGIAEKISWVSSNPLAATVNAVGEVTAMGAGTTTVIATSESGLVAECEVSVTTENPEKKEGYELIFNDDFNGTTLDSSKWNNWCPDLGKSGYFRYGNTPESVVAPENVKVEDGSLHLMGTKDPVEFNGKTSEYKMGTVQTRDKFEPTYGYMEAMVRFPDVEGNNPAVWTMPRRTADGTDWQWNSKEGEAAEIDILERPNPRNPIYANLENKYWTTIHFQNYDSSLKFSEMPAISDAYKWHKFGMDWTKENVKFMLDDKVVATYDGKHVPQAPEMLILSYGLGGWLGKVDPNMSYSEMLVDYVRWYQVDPIKAELNDKAMAINTKETKTLKVNFVKEGQIIDAKDAVKEWTSSDVTVASVDKTGNVTGIKEGAVTITAVTQEGRRCTSEVSVSQEQKYKPGYKLVFEDNFSGKTLDNTKWNNWCVDLQESKPFRYGNSKEVALMPENAYVKDGSLHLLGSKEKTTFDGFTSDYRMGAVQTRDKFEPKYGYMETMIKIPDVPGSNPAIWTMPKASKDGKFQWNNPDGTFGAEIDVLERPHPKGDAAYTNLENKYWVTMHYDNYNFDKHPKYHTQPTINEPYKWHKFGMEWTPQYINFILDGNVVAFQNKDVPNVNEIFILSYGLGGWIGKIADQCLPAEMLVDYVRWYQLDETIVSIEPSERKLKAREEK